MAAISSIIAAAGVAASVGGAISQNRAAKQSAKAAAATAAANNAISERQFNYAKDQYDPYIQGGASAFDLYGKSLGLQGNEGVDSALGVFYNSSPDFKEALRVGTGNVQQSTASQGNFLSGSRLRAVMDYGGSSFNKYLSDWRNSLLQGTEMGMRGVGGVVSAGNQNVNNQTANNNMALGARQSAYQANANAWNAGLSGVSKVLGSGAGQSALSSLFG